MTTEPTTPPSRAPIDDVRAAIFTPMAVRAAVQLGVFTPLAGGPMTAGDLADALGVKPRRLEALLYQLVVSEFLTVEDGRFANTAMAAYYLVEGEPNYFGGIQGVWNEVFNAMMQTAESIQTDAPQNKIDFSGMSQAELSSFIKGLHSNTLAVGRSLSAQPEFTDATSLLDVGGGSGGLAIALCEAHPKLHATVVELPSVVPIAAEMVEEAGLAERIIVTSRNILNDPLEGDFDIATARSLFQVLSATECAAAAQNIGAGLVRGGTLFVIGAATDDSHLAPLSAVGMNLTFQSLFDGGAAYTESTYRTWLTNAGFADITREPHMGGASLFTARKT
jgi:hypothetical protein